MEDVLSNIRIQINEKLYLKDPESSALGSSIVSEGIRLINQIGFEQFTFKKLAKSIESTESSVYRYFENKHKFLLYITSLYWSYMEYSLVLATNSIEDKFPKLLKAVEIVTGTPNNSFFNTSVDQIALREIVISEFTKAYHNKSVDEENKQGFFKVYKRLVIRLKDMIEDVDKNCSYAKSLASLLLDGALHQHFLAMHFKSITNCTTAEQTVDFFKLLLTNQLKHTKNELN